MAGVTPGGDQLLRLAGWPTVQKALAAIDAVDRLPDGLPRAIGRLLTRALLDDAQTVLDEIDRAHALGIEVRPVITGPLSLLLLVSGLALLMRHYRDLMER